MKSLNYLMDHILYQIFKIKTGYYLDLLTRKTIKLLGSAKSKMTKSKNCEIVRHLEITEIILVDCNIVNNNYQHNPRVLYTFVLINHVDNY